MKLIICPQCSSVFNLEVGKMKECSCGACRGRYINEYEAEVTEGCISLTIGNGSLINAINDMRSIKHSTSDKADRRDYIEGARISHAWIRPNTGPGNPHTKLIKEKNE